MKKLYYLLLPVLAAGNLQAQQNINFEVGGNGANYSWNVFENETNPPLAFVANPNPSGINTSPTVAHYVTSVNGAPWAGCETVHGQIGTFVLDADHATVKIMVYKSVISDVGVKLVAPDNSAQPEIRKPNTVINQWEELTFNFSGSIGMTIDQIVIFPDFSPIPRTYGSVNYFDNITWGVAEAMPQPMTAAPDPTMAAANVISMFSGVYNNVPVDTWLTGWSQAIHQELQIQGNATKKYSNLNYAGIETYNSGQINATGMTHFNLDVWSHDFTQLRVKLVDFGPNAAYGGGDDTEHEVVYNNPAQNQWITYNIPLSDFTSLVNRNHISQLILSSNGTSTVFFDNIYFSNNAPAGVNDFRETAVAIYPNPVKDVLNIQAVHQVSNVTVHNALGQQVYQATPETVSASLNVEQLQNGIYSIQIESNGATATKKFIKQ
jgi:hypothetical protein